MLQRVGTSWSQPLVTISMDEELLGAPPEGLEPKGPDHGDVLDPPRLCAVRSKDLSSATALAHSRGRQRPQGLRLTCLERVERADERGAQRWRESRPGRRTWHTTLTEHVLKTHDPKCNSAFPRRRPRWADLLYPGISPYLRFQRLLLLARDAADITADPLAVQYTAGRVSEPAIPGARRPPASRSCRATGGRVTCVGCRWDTMVGALVRWWNLHG